jgi:cell division protein FtsW (lipid II flippase)
LDNLSAAPAPKWNTCRGRHHHRSRRKLLTVISVILLIAGLVFVAQGSGYFPHPAESFMINQTRWVYYGAAIAVAGLLLGVVARR